MGKSRPTNAAIYIPPQFCSPPLSLMRKDESPSLKRCSQSCSGSDTSRQHGRLLALDVRARESLSIFKSGSIFPSSYSASARHLGNQHASPEHCYHSKACDLSPLRGCRKQETVQVRRFRQKKKATCKCSARKLQFLTSKDAEKTPKWQPRS